MLPLGDQDEVEPHPGHEVDEKKQTSDTQRVNKELNKCLI